MNFKPLALVITLISPAISNASTMAGQLCLAQARMMLNIAESRDAGRSRNATIGLTHGAASDLSTSEKRNDMNALSDAFVTIAYENPQQSGIELAGQVYAACKTLQQHAQMGK